MTTHELLTKYGKRYGITYDMLKYARRSGLLKFVIVPEYDKQCFHNRVHFEYDTRSVIQYIEYLKRRGNKWSRKNEA